MKAKLKLPGEATEPAAPLTLHPVATIGDEIICADAAPARPKIIAFPPPPESPAAFRDWLAGEVFPKLAHLPPDEVATRVTRIVYEHEQKMFARVAYHAGRIKNRLQQKQWWGHEKDLDPIVQIATAPPEPTPAPVPAVVPTDEDGNVIEQPPAAPAEPPMLGVKW